MSEISVDIEALVSELSAWKENKGKVGGRVPERFWKPAIELAKVLGPSKVAKQTGLCEAQLRKRLRKDSATAKERAQALTPTFVEMLVGSPQSGQSHKSRVNCAFKVKSTSGARMQADVAELSLSDLTVVLREFAR